MSEELGLRLLNPTAGARTLMRHLTSDDPVMKKEREDKANLSKQELENK